MRLRRLNEQGLLDLKQFLNSGTGQPVPQGLLTQPMTSEEIAGGPDLEPFTGTINGFQFARYLHEQFESAGTDAKTIEGPDGRGDPGFWGAVSLFYFDLLTPGYRTGRKKAKAENCYIPETGRSIALGRYFRHRAAGAYRLYKRFKDYSEPLLLSPPGEQNELYSTITDIVRYTETPCIVQAIHLLYFNKDERRLNPGWNAQDEPGSLPRLLAVVDQFDLTYDLLDIDGQVLLTQLPEEFDAWKKGRKR